MDIIYPVDTRQKAPPLKYSIRSAEKNLKFKNLFIVGKKPEFLNEKAKEIYFIDTQRPKAVNLMDKLVSVIEDERVSEKFILMNDDFYIMEEFSTIPYYHLGKIKEKPKAHLNHWKERTEILLERFPEGNFFGIHFPIVYEKKKLKKMFEKEDTFKIADSSVRTWYCNYFKIKGEQEKDHKIRSSSQILKMEELPFFSTSNGAEMSLLFKKFMKKIFNQKSKYEA